MDRSLHGQAAVATALALRLETPRDGQRQAAEGDRDDQELFHVEILRSPWHPAGQVKKSHPDHTSSGDDIFNFQSSI